MQGEELVVGVAGEQVPFRRQKLQPHHHGEEAAQDEHDGDRDHVQDADPFVILGQQPGERAVVDVEIITTLRRLEEADIVIRHRGHDCPFGPAGVAGTPIRGGLVSDFK